MDIDSDDMMLSSLIVNRKERETVTKKGNKAQIWNLSQGTEV